MIVLTNVNKCIIVVPSMIDTNIFVELTKTDSKTLYRPKEDIKINSLLLKLTNQTKIHSIYLSLLLLTELYLFPSSTQTNMEWTQNLSQPRLASLSKKILFWKETQIEMELLNSSQHVNLPSRKWSFRYFNDCASNCTINQQPNAITQ